MLFFHDNNNYTKTQNVALYLHCPFVIIYFDWKYKFLERLVYCRGEVNIWKCLSWMYLLELTASSDQSGSDMYVLPEAAAVVVVVIVAVVAAVVVVMVVVVVVVIVELLLLLLLFYEWTAPFWIVFSLRFRKLCFGKLANKYNNWAGSTLITLSIYIYAGLTCWDPAFTISKP